MARVTADPGKDGVKDWYSFHLVKGIRTIRGFKEWFHADHGFSHAIKRNSNPIMQSVDEQALVNDVR